MLTALLAFCIFGLVFSVVYALYLYYARSKISEKLTLDKKTEETEPFLDVLWEYKKAGISTETAIKYGVASTGVGLFIGLFVSIGVAIICAASGFVLGPRLYLKFQKRRLIKQFDVQFPRAVSSFSAAAKVMPLASCFEYISKEMPSPSKEVFTYISNAIQFTNIPVAQAVRDASMQFDLPQLIGFAEALQILDEIGGGDEATALLEAVAEETRFKRRHEMEVKSIFGELQATMIASTAIPILMLLYFASDKNGIHAQIFKTAPWLIVCGMVVLAVGWFISRSMINSASKTL